MRKYEKFFNTGRSFFSAGCIYFPIFRVLYQKKLRFDMIEFYRFKYFDKYDNLMHAVTNKSTLFDYDLSLALHTGEDENKIIANRELVAKKLSSSNELTFIVANQTHSINVKVIKKKETKGWQSSKDAIEDCDALVTNLKNVVLSILTADCVPILLYDTKKDVIAAVHAGWKGTQGKIVEKTIAKMQDEFDCNVKDIVAGVAPSIGKCCYEVGIDVAEHFFDTPKGFKQIGEKYMLDLPYINKKQLLDASLSLENIEMSEVCTACEVDSYFSYRKEQGCSGRFMSMIGLK
jgi:YfiH family protein